MFIYHSKYIIKNIFELKIQKIVKYMNTIKYVRIHICTFFKHS